MSIRDSLDYHAFVFSMKASNPKVMIEAYRLLAARLEALGSCLLYTSDAADERSSVDLGGRRIIKKKTKADNAQSLLNSTNTVLTHESESEQVT